MRQSIIEGNFKTELKRHTSFEQNKEYKLHAYQGTN